MFVEFIFSGNNENITYLLKLIYECPIEELSELIIDTIGNILYQVIKEEENPDEYAIKLINKFGELHHDLIEFAISLEKGEEAQRLFHLKNEFIGLIAFILKRLPNSIGLGDEWLNKIKLSAPGGKEIAAAKLCSSTSLH